MSNILLQLFNKLTKGINMKQVRVITENESKLEDIIDYNKDKYPWKSSNNTTIVNELIAKEHKRICKGNG